MLNTDPTQQTTRIDRVLAATLLRFIPQSVTPNQVTIFRFFTVPFIAWFFLSHYYLLGGILFMLAALSDAVDGALARTRNQVTDWGKLYDPLADKFLISVTAIILIPAFLGAHLAAIIVGIEVFFIAGTYLRRKQSTAQIIQANSIGKMKMFLQSLGIGLLIFFILSDIVLFLAAAEFVFYAAIALALVNLVIYRSI